MAENKHSLQLKQVGTTARWYEVRFVNKGGDWMVALNDEGFPIEGDKLDEIVTEAKAVIESSILHDGDSVVIAQIETTYFAVN